MNRRDVITLLGGRVYRLGANDPGRAGDAGNGRCNHVCDPVVIGW
jgi:hypothetical protein